MYAPTQNTPNVASIYYYEAEIHLYRAWCSSDRWLTYGEYCLDSLLRRLNCEVCVVTQNYLEQMLELL